MLNEILYSKLVPTINYRLQTTDYPLPYALPPRPSP